MLINLCNITDFNITQENVIDFANQYNQLDYFKRRIVSTYDLNIQADGSRYIVIIPKALIELENVNYLYFKGVDNRYYFYFVMDRAFKTKDSTVLFIKLDSWQTFMFDYELLESFIDRCHVPRWNGDKPTKEYEPEEINFGENILVDYTDLVGMSTGVVFATTVPIGKLPTSSEGGGDSGESGGGGTCDGVIDNPKLNGQAKYQQDFINAIYPSARYDFSKYNIFASIKLSQAVLESDWGRSKLATEGKNLFGIKADSSWTGKKGQYPTTEYVDGKPVTVMAWFRHYDSWADSVHDHTKFLLDNPRYKEAGVFDAKTNLEQAEALRRAGYATDPNYPSLLMSVINGSDLFLYDKKCDLNPSVEGKFVDNKAGDNWLVPAKGSLSALYPKYPSGNPHNGIDIACPVGTPVRASKDGTVIDRQELTTSYGKFLKIQSGDSIVLYCHNSELLVKIGDKVKQGDVIAKSGNTGYSTGPHLHWEIRNDKVGEVIQYNTKTVNPYPNAKLNEEV